MPTSQPTTHEQPKTAKVDSKTNLPIGEMGERFKRAMQQGAEAARKTDQTLAPPDASIAQTLKTESKEAPAAPVETKTATEPVKTSPKGIPELKDAPEIPKMPEIKEPTDAKTAAKDAKDAKKNTPEFNFRQLEAARDELAKKNAEYEAKVKELGTELEKFRKGDAPEVANMRGELEKYQELVSRYYLEHDPRFQAAFDGKIQTAIAEAKEAVGPEMAAKVEQVLLMPDGEVKTAQLREMMADLEDFEASGLRLAYNEIRRLNREKQAELSKAKENRTKMEQFDALSKAEEAKKAAAERDTFAEATLSEAAQHLPEFRKVTGNDDYNKLVDENITNFKQVMSAPLNPKDQAKLAVWAVRGYRSAEREAAQVALIQKLQATIEQLQGSQPSVESGSMTAAKPKEVGISDITDRFHKAMTGQR